MSSNFPDVCPPDAEHLARIVALQNEVAIAPLDLQSLMQLIAERMQDLTGADGAAFELLEGEEMVYRAASGTTAPFVGLRLSVHSSLSGKCVLSHEVLVCEDSETDPRVDREACRKVGARSMIVVPLPRSDRIVGVLKVLSARPHAFHLRDRQALELMAALLGGMANHASLIAEQAEALRQSEERYRTIINSTSEGIWMVDAQLRTTFVNGQLAEVLQYSPEEMLGKAPVDFLFEEDLARLEQRLVERRKGKSEVSEIRLRRKDGSPIWFLSSATPLLDHHGEFRGSLALLTNINERKRMEEQLLQAQKLESLGRLAGGVAHDFNNLLTAILGFSELLDEEFELNVEGKNYLANIYQAAEKAAGLTRQLLAFARRQVIEPKVINLNELILSLNMLLRRLIGENIELTMLPCENLASVKVDPGQFEQILVNLVVNARDAMPDGGKITIETQNATLDEEYARLHDEVVPGEYVMLAVSDTGSGMEEGIRLHIFEPFFTTKEKGRGTGLGLATVYGIVRQAGGHIWLYSESGEGTTFKIYLPRTQSAPTEEKVAPVSDPHRGTETILLVEDEPAVRALAALTLRGRGYTVLEAMHGEEALRLAGAYSGEIALLVTDVIMPQMSGKELADRLHGLRPQMKALFASGYTENTIVHHGVLEQGIAFLSKPFTPSALAQKVREILNSD